MYERPRNLQPPPKPLLDFNQLREPGSKTQSRPKLTSWTTPTYGHNLISPRKVVETSPSNQNDRHRTPSNSGLRRFHCKMIPKLANWQLVSISLKINSEYEHPRNFQFSLKLLVVQNSENNNCERHEVND